MSEILKKKTKHTFRATIPHLCSFLCWNPDLGWFCFNQCLMMICSINRVTTCADSFLSQRWIYAPHFVITCSICFMNLNKHRKWVHIVLLRNHDRLQWRLLGFFFILFFCCDSPEWKVMEVHGCTYCGPPPFSLFKHLKFNDEDALVLFSAQTRLVSPGCTPHLRFQSSHSTCNTKT